jgi:hypothetical protein
MNQGLSIANLLMLTNTVKAAQRPLPTQQMPNLMLNLQSIIYKQQAALTNLMALYSQNKSQVVPEFNVKLEEPKILASAVNRAENTLAISQQSEENSSEDTRESSPNLPTIIRKNGFKSNKVTEKEDEKTDSKKSKKTSTPKRPPSKAKHLWINYGRKIIEYAINHTQGEVQNRVRHYIGKLSSKKDFANVFGIKPSDSEEDKLFKLVFGKVALFFIKFKAESAFQGSKYRDQMITQKNIVKSWIEQLIGAN